MWFLGMDVGTSGTRAVLVDVTGARRQLGWSPKSMRAPLPHAAPRLG